MLSIGQLLPKPILGDTESTMSTCLLFVFSFLYAIVKQTPVLVFHATQKTCSEIRVKCLSQRHKDVIPCMGIEPQTLRSPTQPSNQLNYNAADLCFIYNVCSAQVSKKKRNCSKRTSKKTLFWNMWTLNWLYLLQTRSHKKKTQLALSTFEWSGVANFSLQVQSCFFLETTNPIQLRNFTMTLRSKNSENRSDWNKEL